MQAFDGLDSDMEPALSIGKRQILTSQEAKTYVSICINLAWLIMYATPPHKPNLVVVAQRMWSRHMREISHLCFFSFFAFFITTTGRIS